MLLEYSKRYMLDLLDSFGVDVFSNDYKQQESYQHIKNEPYICVENGVMTIEQFVDCFLIEREDLLDVEAIYDMGNPYELDKTECTDESVAESIIKDFNLAEQEGNPLDAIEFSSRFYRKRHGVLDRLNKYLDIDLELFDDTNEKHQRERAKIIYLIYALENRYFPKTNVLELISKSSIENIDSSFMGMRTYNGHITKRMKIALEKEMALSKESLMAKNEIKDTLGVVSREWDTFCAKAGSVLDYPQRYGFESDIENIANEMSSSIIFPLNHDLLEFSPVETLYLRILQLEYLGQTLVL